MAEPVRRPLTTGERLVCVVIMTVFVMAIGTAAVQFDAAARTMFKAVTNLDIALRR